MADAHEKGSPVMRTCFFEFPDDEECWKVEDQYMYGDAYLVAPVLYPVQRKRKVYLPKGSWKAFGGEKLYRGGQYHEVECPLASMPVFTKVS